MPEASKEKDKDSDSKKYTLKKMKKIAIYDIISIIFIQLLKYNFIKIINF